MVRRDAKAKDRMIGLIGSYPQEATPSLIYFKDTLPQVDIHLGGLVISLPV